jgi:hypothetical protein
VPGGSVHAKEFLYTSPDPYGCPVLSESAVDDGFTDHITISIHTLTFQTTVNNLYRDFVTWKEVIQKPRGNILTEDFRITVSISNDVRHEPQCRNQTKEPMKMSLCVAVIPMPHKLIKVKSIVGASFLNQFIITHVF